MASYLYQAVTANGAGCHGLESKSLTTALEFAGSLRGYGFSDSEVQRFTQSPSGVRRYWMRSGKRWELWSPERDIEARKPNFGIAPWLGAGSIPEVKP